MKNKFDLKLKDIASFAYAFIFIALLTSCMDMKHGKKTDMTNRGVGVVWIKHDNFSPGNITVPVNTTVTWTNKDLWPHTVTSDEGSFDSKKIKHKKSYSYKFTTKGIYKYHFSIHDKMIAKVIVQ